MASGCLYENAKKKVSSSNVSPKDTPAKTITSTGAKDNTQKKDDKIVKSDTLTTVVSDKSPGIEYPEITDTLKTVNSGYFILEEKVEVLKKEMNELKTENNSIKEDIKSLKIELETWKKDIK